jgi:hypothetical protein
VTVLPGGRDDEIEALVVDRYLDSLLARRPLDRASVSDELDATARRLTEALPRFHPSFHFEEALAARLATAAAGGTGRGGAVIHWAERGPAAGPADRPGLARPVVIGSVVTSAAISLAGAAFVAWRRTRPGDPMSRAVRAIARTRIA